MEGVVNNPRSWGVTTTEPIPAMMLQVGDALLPSYIGTISISHYKDPYYPYCFFCVGHFGANIMDIMGCASLVMSILSY